MPHARLSASQTKWWWNCPGAIATLEHYPTEDTTSDAARMGTCAHALGERCLEEGSEPEAYLGRIIVILNEGEENEGTSILKNGAKAPKAPDAIWFEVDHDMVDAVERLTTYVRHQVMSIVYGLDEYDDPTMPIAYSQRALEEKRLFLETHVNPLPERNDTGGTADVRIDGWPDILEVIDYKHGAGVFVPVEGNHQLRSYALGAAKEDDFAHERYRYTIVQPRHQNGGIMSEEMTREELQAWDAELNGAAERVDETDARATELVPHCKDQWDMLTTLMDEGYVSVGSDGSHCTFCPLKVRCPAVHAKAEEVAMTDFGDDPEHIDAPSGDRALEMLERVLPWVPFIDKFLRECEAEAERILLTGKPVTGKKLVRKKTNRRYIDQTDDELAAALKNNFGLKDEDIWKRSLITGPQAEKLIPKGERKRFNEELLFKPEGALTMANEDDKRDEVTVDPASDFDDDLED